MVSSSLLLSVLKHGKQRQRRSERQISISWQNNIMLELSVSTNNVAQEVARSAPGHARAWGLSSYGLFRNSSAVAEGSKRALVWRKQRGKQSMARKQAAGRRSSKKRGNVAGSNAARTWARGKQSRMRNCGKRCRQYSGEMGVSITDRRLANAYKGGLLAHHISWRKSDSKRREEQGAGHMTADLIMSA